MAMATRTPSSPLSGILSSDGKKSVVDFKPLCFSREVFNEEDFSVDQFLSDFRRRALPLDSVLSDLRKYGTSLESQLLELINQDYADFVNLSSNLQGIDKVIENLRAPIHTLRNEVSSIHDVVQDEIIQVEDKLAQRTELQQKKYFLTLFLDIYQIICKIEALLRVGESNPVQFNNSDEDTSNLIQRVANDFNQLKYYVSRTKDFPFVKNLADRIDRIETTMQEGLEALFCDGLQNSDRDVISNCLRTYAAIDRITDVELLFLSKKAEPFLKTVINNHIYEEHGLRFIFDKTVAWIQSDCALLLELTHKSVKGFDFLTNAVFKCTVDLMISQIPDAFGAGFPAVFHKNYLVAQSFLNQIEEFFVTITELQEFRNSSEYNDFQKRWNVSIYFGLRYQGIARAMEKAFQEPASYKGPSSSVGTPIFSYPQATILWEQLKICWSRDIFIPALTDSFFKLSLQLISRYSSWVIDGIEGMSKDDVDDILWTKTVPEDQFIVFYQDMEVLRACLPTSYVSAIQSLQPSLDSSVYDILKKSYSNLGSLNTARNRLGEILCDRITKLCLVSLQPVKGIMQTYRITNKAPSNHPSFYVQNIFSHLHKFLANENVQKISSNSKQNWIDRVVSEVTTKYLEWAVDMLQTAEKQNSILKKFIKAAKEPENGGASALKVDEKIAIQLSLDVTAYGEELKKLGVALENFQAFQKLSECFLASLPENKQETD